MKNSVTAARHERWLKLRLKDGQRIEGRYNILHTHFAIYSHLLEQGYSIAFYEASGYQRNSRNAVIYIRTDHEGFYKSCCQYYAYDFDITDLAAGFVVPSSFRLMMGVAASRLAS